MQIKGLALFVLLFGNLTYGFEGFMSSSFNDFSTNNADFVRDKFIFTQNQYSINGKALSDKAYSQTESLVRYLPFVTLSNSGFGASVNLRNTNRTKLYLNGINIDNNLQHFNGFSPLNTISPSLVEKITLVLGGAVRYGSGAKGGIVDIQTLSNSRKSLFGGGVSYNQIAASSGSYDTYLVFKDNFGSAFFANLGFVYSELNGQRQNDNATQINAKTEFIFYLNDFNALDLQMDFYRGDISWGKFNGFSDYSDYDTIMTDRFSSVYKIDTYTNRMHRVKNTPPLTPTKDNANAPSSAYEPQGVMQDRVSASVKYELEFSPDTRFELQGFLNQNKISYKEQILQDEYVEFSSIIFKDMKVNYQGSAFDEQKLGLNTRFDYKHKSGKFTLGTQSLYEQAKRTTARTLANDQLFVRNRFSVTNSIVWAFDYDTKQEISSNQLSNAIYVMEKYDFGRFFSLLGGARYELVSKKLDIQGVHKNNTIQRQLNTPNSVHNRNDTVTMLEAYNTSESKKMMAFELMPSLNYSNSGLLYARYERGFTNLPPLYMAQRKFTNFKTTPNFTNTNSVDITYETTNFNDEIYDNFELGFKDFFSTDNLTLLFSANGFYTLTQNEFYAIRHFNPAVEVRANIPALNASAVDSFFTSTPILFGTYEKTRRMGFELALEQYLFNGILALQESLSHTKTHAYVANEWIKMPYNYEYKATLSANVELFSWLNVWVQNSFFGVQSIIGKKALTNTSNQPIAQNRILQEVEFQENLEPYIISDIGISVKLWGLSLSCGVRNILDTFYYDYYNKDSIDTATGFGYLIGTGRTYFLQAHYMW